VELPGLRRTVRRGEGDLMTTDAPVGRGHSVFHPLRVATIEPLTDEAVAVTFDVPAALSDQFRHRAGQHLSIRVPELGDLRRNYSICAPAGSGLLRIGVKRIPDGVCSGYLTRQLRPGDLLDVMTPTGSFGTALSPDRARRYAAIAAGSGITPVLSILATALQVEPASRAVLIYVNRTSRSIMFLDEVADLKDRYVDRFQLVHVLDQEAHDVELLSGRVDADRLDRILTTLVGGHDVDEWFLCGPLPMTDVARAVLLEHGADPASVHRELFHVAPPSAGTRRPSPPPAASDTDGADSGDGAAGAAGAAAVTVLLDGRSQTVSLPRDGDSILAATLAVRPDAPYACTNGVCGTCRAKLVEGQVRMDANYALEPAELAAGFVLTCQSHPVTDRVVLDFDR
jgi:ring-1,2-phenylacetyl-CoA epoxidase subunit PaaE